MTLMGPSQSSELHTRSSVTTVCGVGLQVLQNRHPSGLYWFSISACLSFISLCSLHPLPHPDSPTVAPTWIDSISACLSFSSMSRAYSLTTWPLSRMPAGRGSHKCDREGAYS